MRDEQRRSAEARTGALTFLAGVWLIAAPPLLDFGAAQQYFRPYWVPLVVAVVVMLAGMLRAVAPLDVPWLRVLTVVLAAALVVTALLHTDVNAAVKVNQVAVGAGLAVVSLVVAVDGGEWLR